MADRATARSARNSAFFDDLVAKPRLFIDGLDATAVSPEAFDSVGLESSGQHTELNESSSRSH
jgi:hypothetical protein